MKTIAIFILVILVIFWLLRRMNPGLIMVTSGKLPSVVSSGAWEEKGLRCSLRLENTESSFFVTSLDLDRNTVERAHITPPFEFRAEPMPDDGGDPEWVESWNRENVRYVGRLELRPNAETELLFPCAVNTGHKVLIKGQFTNGRKFGGSISFFRMAVPGMDTQGTDV